ncbi:hypothetical protein HPB47_025696, partial [Ixodes persulcatus]
HSLVSESKAVKALDGPFLKRMDGMAHMTQKNIGGGQTLGFGGVFGHLDDPKLEIRV